MRQDEAIFTFTPQKGSKWSSVLLDLLLQEDFKNYVSENAGKNITIHLEHTISKSEKSRMYKYLNGPLIRAVMEAKRHFGDPKDKVECMLEMKCLFAKDIVVVNGNSHAVIMSQSDMNKKQLLTFIQDIIHHIEEEYGWKAPDAQEYLLKNLRD